MTSLAVKPSYLLDPDLFLLKIQLCNVLVHHPKKRGEYTIEETNFSLDICQSFLKCDFIPFHFITSKNQRPTATSNNRRKHSLKTENQENISERRAIPTNSMAYGIRRFNAAFTGALQ